VIQICYSLLNLVFINRTYFRALILNSELSLNFDFVAYHLCDLDKNLISVSNFQSLKRV
jgi:hypothetical protein